jgi:hypothetical protein
VNHLRRSLSTLARHPVAIWFNYNAGMKSLHWRQMDVWTVDLRPLAMKIRGSVVPGRLYIRHLAVGIWPDSGMVSAASSKCIVKFWDRITTAACDLKYKEEPSVLTAYFQHEPPFVKSMSDISHPFW